MTPEERARQVTLYLIGDDSDDYTAGIAKAIREAERDAMEHVAKVAEEKFSDPGWHAMAKMAALAIAHDVRSLIPQDRTTGEET